MQRRRADLILGLSVVLALSVVVSSDQGRGGPVDPLAYVWAVGLGALMLIRRQHPLVVLALTALGFFTYHAAGFPSIGVAVPMAAALYSAAETGHPRAGALAATLTLAVATLYRLLAGQDPALVLGYELISHGATMVAVLALGHNVRTAHRLRLRTDQVTRLLERQGALDADARIREDRMHLARELHDSIGHSLSVASLYTSVAREADDDADKRLQAIDLARRGISESLAHLRRTVGLLRESGPPVDSGGPGLDDLPHLAAAPLAAGYDVSLDIEDVHPGPSVEAVVFRVVQEGVTNALRHSAGSRIRIAVREEPRQRLTVVVMDDGAPPHADDIPAHGHGLTGLAERVEDAGGTFEAKPTAEGWMVRAELPGGAGAR